MYLVGSNLEKCGNNWKNGHFSGQMESDWENAAQADMAMGSKVTF